MQYLTTGDVLRIHQAEVGDFIVVDFGLLESAVLRPQVTVGTQDAYPDIHTKAAALMHSLIRHHPFQDGNRLGGIGGRGGVADSIRRGA